MITQTSQVCTELSRVNKIIILLISSIVPQKSSAASVVLYRHLVEEDSIELICVSDRLHDPLTDIEVYPNLILNRLKKTRLARLAHSIRHLTLTENFSKLQIQLQVEPPNLILTVAHDPLCWLAQHCASKFQIPLITFFHDWLPDIAFVPDIVRPILERKFRRLYAQSQLALCVSEEMKQALGKHPNAHVLYPIPEPANHVRQKVDIESVSSCLNVVYSGNLSNIYGPMLRSLAHAAYSENNINLKLLGPSPDWPQSEIQWMSDRQIYQGFVSREQLTKELENTGVLLVVMSFEQRDRRRMETSFPSKLVEYCKFGKPIVIWGPEYCSAVQWARKHKTALIVNSPVAQNCVEQLQLLSARPQESARLRQAAYAMSTQLFNPNHIQKQFLTLLTELVEPT